MDKEIVVHVVKDVQMIHLAIIVVSMKTLWHRFSELGVNVPKKFSCVLSILIKDEYKEVEID